MLALKCWTKVSAIFLLMLCMSGLASYNFIYVPFETPQTIHVENHSITLSLEAGNGGTRRLFTLTLGGQTEHGSTSTARRNCASSSCPQLTTLQQITDLISETGLTSIQLQLVPEAQRSINVEYLDERVVGTDGVRRERQRTTSQLSLALRIVYEGRPVFIPLTATHTGGNRRAAWLWGEEFFTHLYDHQEAPRTVSYLDPLGPEVLQTILTLLTNFLDAPYILNILRQTPTDTLSPGLLRIPDIINLNNATSEQPRRCELVNQQPHWFNIKIHAGRMLYNLDLPRIDCFSNATLSPFTAMSGTVQTQTTSPGHSLAATVVRVSLVVIVVVILLFHSWSW